MTKHLILLLTAALLVFSLTACGCSAKDSGTTITQQTTGTTQDSTSPNTGTSNGDAGLGTGTNPDSAVPGGSDTTPLPGSDTGRTLMDDARRAVNNGVRDTKNALEGAASELGGTGFRQMVRNGRVHDTDGDLTDGENSRSYGKLF